MKVKEDGKKEKEMKKENSKGETSFVKRSERTSFAQLTFFLVSSISTRNFKITNLTSSNSQSLTSERVPLMKIQPSDFFFSKLLILCPSLALPISVGFGRGCIRVEKDERNVIV
jgi:hypothetical protein